MVGFCGSAVQKSVSWLVYLDGIHLRYTTKQWDERKEAEKAPPARSCLKDVRASLSMNALKIHFISLLLLTPDMMRCQKWAKPLEFLISACAR